jgi:hypothetical protein
MIRLLRFWLPVLPIATAVLVAFGGLPDLGSCLEFYGLLSHTALCLDWPSPVVIGPVDVLGRAQILEGDMLAGVFAVTAVAVAVFGVRRIRAMAQ